MKKIFFGIALMFIATLNASATEITTESELDTCISATSNVCVLQANLELNSQKLIEDGNNITIDLNGHTISYSGSTLNSGVFGIKHGGRLVINDSSETGCINSGNAYAAIAMTVKGDTDNTKKAELVINGGHIIGDYYAITGNGSQGRNNTKITINGGKVEAIHTEDNLAIFHPQDGELIVNDGTITGITGIEMRAGKLTINGGHIIGNYSELVTVSNLSGNTTKGAGIAVMQHTTGLPTEVVINNGTIEGFTALIQKKIQSEITEEQDALVTVTINSGNFNAINNGTEAVISETKTEFITGGTYNTDVNIDYLKSDYKKELSGDKYVVSINKIVETTISEGTVQFETDTSIDNSYTLEVIEKDESEKIEVENKVNELYKEDENKIDSKLISLYDINIKDNTGNIIPMSDGNFKISIPVASDLLTFDKYNVIYINNLNEIAEELGAEVINGKIVFSTTHLSTYGIVGYNEPKETSTIQEENPQTGDNIIYNIIFGIVSLICLAGSLLFISKKQELN